MDPILEFLYRIHVLSAEQKQLAVAHMGMPAFKCFCGNMSSETYSYTYTCMYTHRTHIYIYMHIYIRIHIHTYMTTQKNEYMCIHTCVNAQSMHIMHMYTYMYMYMYTYMYM